MNTVKSKDGTAIAFEKLGEGPPLILVDGAFMHRAFGHTDLAERLAEHFTVYRYDRRGRGESGDTAPYAVEREIEDLQALIEEAGGSSYAYGISSGAALALEAAAHGAGITKLALYEAPFIVDDSRPPVPDDIVAQFDAALAADRRGDAVKLFLRQVGAPRIAIALTRLMPVWSKLTGVAHTLPYDLTILAGNQAGRPLPAERWTGVTVPTVVGVGSKSPQWFHNSQRALARALPKASLRVLEGQTHRVKPEVLAPVLADFFLGEDTATGEEPQDEATAVAA